MSEHESNWDTYIRYSAKTDIGMRRSNNQDSHTVVLASDQTAWQDRGHFFMVADGMGAHAAGELASKLAVDGVAHRYRKYAECSPADALRQALVETNAEVHRRGQANSDFRNMGTTASSLVLLPEGAFIAHIGDSRVYRLRDQVLQQLTFDHSLVWELRAAGQLDREAELANTIPKNVITRSLGPNANVQVDIEGPFPVQPGDLFLICSDGLTGKIPDDELATILNHLPLDEASQLLIDLANLRGGPDNITLVVTQIVRNPEIHLHEDEPVTASRQRRDEAINTAVWVGIAVSVLIALVLVITDHLLPAVFAVLFCGVIFVGGALIRKNGGRRSVKLHPGRMLGRAPYSEATAKSVDESTERLARATRGLRQQGAQDLSLDWTKFERFSREGHRQQANGNLDEAALSFARAIRALMVEIRKRQEQQAAETRPEEDAQ